MNVLELCDNLEGTDDPQVARVRFLCIKNLALIEEEVGEFGEAVEYLVEGLRVDPTDAVMALRLAKIALNSFGNVRLARAALETALTSDPMFWPALTMLLEMLFSLGDDLGCLEAASRCLAVQPYFARALEIRAAILVRNGCIGRAMLGSMGGAKPEKSLEIPRLNQVVRDNGSACGAQTVQVRVTLLSWAHVASQTATKLKGCGLCDDVVFSWAEARLPQADPAAPVDDPSNLEESSAKPASPAKQIVLRTDVEQQQQADFIKMLEEMFPWKSVLKADESGLVTETANGGDGASAAQVEDVRRWLSQWSSKARATSVLDSLCEALFSRAKEAWDVGLQRAGTVLGRLVLQWDLPPREYFLGLAEVAVDLCNASSAQRSSSSSSALLQSAKKLIERFCFEFPSVLTSTRVTEMTIRVERVRGLLCKLLGQGDCIEHFKAVRLMLTELPAREMGLPHSRVVANSDWVERELSQVDQAEQCLAAVASFKAKDYVSVVRALSPVLLAGSAASQDMDVKRKLVLLEKLFQSVKELLLSKHELGKLFPRVALVYLGELRLRGGDTAPMSVSVASELRGLLSDVRKVDVAEWSPEDRLKLQCHCAALVATCRGNKQFHGLLSSAWETLFVFMERPLTQAGLNLLHHALATIVELDACRLNRGSFLRLVISEMLPGIQRFRGEDDEEAPEQWTWAVHQAIQCLFGVRMSNVKKGHKCEVKGDDSLMEQLAEVFLYVGSNLQDPGMAGLSRKIYQHFSVLPAQLHTRFADVQAMVFDGAQDESAPGTVLRLPEKIRDGHNIPHFSVYEAIYALHVVHVLPVKFCKRLHNKSRQVVRSASQRKWFESKSLEEAKKILLLDLTVNPDRFESWFMLGMLLRATADHRLALEMSPLIELSAEARAKQAECRAAAMRSFQRSLLCSVNEGGKNGRDKKKFF